MDSFPIPQSDSLLSQVQAGIDLQNEGLSAVLQGIGAGAAEGLALQATNNKKCIQKLNKQIRDQLKQQNDYLMGVLDQLLSTLTTLIGEQAVSLAQTQGAIGIQFPFSPQQGQQNATQANPNTGTLQPGTTNAGGIGQQSGGGQTTGGSLEGPFPIVPNLLPSNLPPQRPIFPTLGPVPTQNIPSQPTKQPGTPVPSQDTSSQTNGAYTGGSGGGSANPAIATLPPQVQQAIYDTLTSFGSSSSSVSEDSLNAIINLVMAAQSSVQPVQQQQSSLPGVPVNDGSQRINVCMQPCNVVDVSVASSVADDIDVGVYVNGDEEIQDEYVELETP